MLRAQRHDRDHGSQTRVDQRARNQICANLVSDLAEDFAGGAGLGRCPGEKANQLGCEHLVLDQQEDDQHQDDEPLRDPDREIGETVTQLVDQEGAVGVTEPVDRPGFRQDRPQIRLLAYQSGDPPAHLPGEAFDIRGQRISRLQQCLGRQCR